MTESARGRLENKEIVLYATIAAAFTFGTTMLASCILRKLQED